MRLAKTIGVTLLVGSTALAFALPANSAPLMSAQAGLSKAAPSSTETVQYWHRGYGYHHHHGGGGAGALIGGPPRAPSSAVRSPQAKPTLPRSSIRPIARSGIVLMIRARTRSWRATATGISAANIVPRIQVTSEPRAHPRGFCLKLGRRTLGSANLSYCNFSYFIHEVVCDRL